MLKNNDKDDMGWFVPGERKRPIKRTTSPTELNVERAKLKSVKLAPQVPYFKVSDAESLNKRTKKELIDEVVRLQTMQRDVAIQIGICQSSKSGERVIEQHFAANIITLLNASQSYNL